MVMEQKETFDGELAEWLQSYFVSPEHKDLLPMFLEIARGLHEKHSEIKRREIYREAYETAIPIVGQVYDTAYRSIHKGK